MSWRLRIPRDTEADMTATTRKLPRLRNDLRLYEGATQADGAPSWRILDPVRNRFFELGWLEVELLRRWDVADDPDDLLRRVRDETTLDPAAADLAELLAFLTSHQLIVPEGDEARGRLRARWLVARRPWYESLLHHYLFFRIPLLKPDRFLEATLPWARLLVRPGCLYALVAVALIDLVVLARQWDGFSSTFLYFFSLDGLVLYGCAAVFSKVVHELAHAYTAKNYGVRVPTMGVAFLVMWPVLYTDTGETWRLASPRDRFRIAAAGIAAELALALLATLAWSLTTEGPLRSAFFLLATTTWVITLAINASPFMRFDGYFLLADALDIPNLHERSSAMARIWLRNTFFGLNELVQEQQWSPSRRAALIVFAFSTWLYRLILFLGIALLVYHLFFKLAGLFLMAVEVVWFVVRPVTHELKYLWGQRAAIRVSPRASGAAAVVFLAFVWLVPVAASVSAPALMRAEFEQTVYPPLPARVAEVSVTAGQRVRKGETLARLDSPELSARIARAEARIRGFEIELALRSTSAQRLERAVVVQQQLAESRADLQAAQAEAAQLMLVALHDGVVRDLANDLVANRWVNPRQPLMRIIGAGSAVIDVYVGEAEVASLQTGQPVRFYPDVAGRKVIDGNIASIDSAANLQLPHPLLASTYGGGVAVSAQQSGLRPHETLYRVTVRPEYPSARADLLRGSARIDTGLFAIGANFFSRLGAAVLRESGF